MLLFFSSKFSCTHACNTLVLNQQGGKGDASPQNHDLGMQKDI